MVFYLVIATFILSAAIISGSIIVTMHLKSTYQQGLFSSLLYFLAFYFTFGFYALWGQLLATTLLQENVDANLLERITDIMIVLGSPFMIFASIMFIKLTREMSGRKTRDSMLVIFIVGSSLIIVALAYAFVNYGNFPSRVILRNYYIVLIFLFTVLGVCYLLMPKKGRLKFRYHDLVKLSLVLVVLLVLQLVFLQFSSSHIIVSQLFIIPYFLYGGVIPLFLKYGSDLSNFGTGRTDVLDDFFREYGISPREKEIIMEICMGLTNKQIADRLYISLQTVKDHTTRIYSKTNCTSRTQLIHMINDLSRSFSVIKGTK